MIIFWETLLLTNHGLMYHGLPLSTYVDDNPCDHYINLIITINFLSGMSHQVSQQDGLNPRFLPSEVSNPLGVAPNHPVIGLLKKSPLRGCPNATELYIKPAMNLGTQPGTYTYVYIYMYTSLV